MKAISITQPERECGFRQEGGVYLSTPQGDANGEIPLFIPFHPPVPVQRGPHRNLVLVLGSAVLSKLGEDQWLVKASLDRFEKMKADQWFEEIFGMTLKKRLSTGDCKNKNDAEEALQEIITKVTFTGMSRAAIKNMSTLNIHELPNVGAPFGQLVQSVQEYCLKKNPVSLVKASGYAWSMVEKAQPRHKTQVAEQVSVLLVTMGLKRDALEMRIKYNV